MNYIAMHAVIRGQVQGVGYRDWTCSTAWRLGLWGWVRNLPDGAVEMVINGPTNDVEAMLAECRDGPPLARVEDVRTMQLGGEARMPDGAPLSGFLRI